jgi:hypothetical protein
MKSLRSFSTILILAVSVIATSPLAAHAQSFTRGKFTLSSETHWGTAVLFAGSYEFLLQTSTAPARVILRKADGEYVAVVVPMFTSTQSSATTSSLHLESRGSEVFVSSLYLNDPNTELHFTVPKAGGALMARTAARVSLPAVVATAK